MVDSFGSLVSNCQGTAKTEYGSCGTCATAVADINSLCGGQPAGCAAACTTDLLDPLKECSECINLNADSATLDSVSQVQDLQNSMDAQCKNQGVSCTDQCSTIQPQLEEQCGTSSFSFSGCQNLCSTQFNSASACMSCQEGPGGALTDLLTVAWGTLQFYCKDSCGSTCMEVVDKVNSECIDDTACRTAMCTDDSKSKLDQCISCFPSAPILQSQKDELSTLSTVVDLCKAGAVTCDDECTTIRALGADLCDGVDTEKCKGMCSTENLNAVSNCNVCVNHPDFAGEEGGKEGFGTWKDTLENWCKTDEKTDGSGGPDPPPPPPPPISISVSGGGGGGGGSGGGGTGTRVTIGAPAGASSTRRATSTSGRAASTTAKPKSSAQAIAIDHTGAALGFVAAILAFVAV
ncbi:hypothetical protein CcaverHIS002_0600880 [Cutaneotrichosporon cavernicola]|nr:hypothetical protein CcaverHIS002_0600880 [Cutaneotrichosporon cavernicola]